MLSTFNSIVDLHRNGHSSTRIHTSPTFNSIVDLHEFALDADVRVTELLSIL